MVFLRVITFFSGCLGLIVIGLGAWTRLADAGLGCPDWPGCYGFVTIPTSPEEIDVANSRFPGSPYELAKAIPEVVHRYFAATLGFLILCISLLAHREKSVSSSIKKLSLLVLRDMFIPSIIFLGELSPPIASIAIFTFFCIFS